MSSKIDRPWTPEEAALLTTKTNEEIALITGRSKEAIRSKRRHLALTGGTAQSQTADEPTSFEQDKAAAEGSYWRRQYRDLERKYQRALQEGSAASQLVTMAASLAPQSYNPAPPVRVIKPGNGAPQSAVLMLSDTHVGQVIRPDQTLGFGEYNFDVFLRRLHYYESAVTSILRDHTTTEISELVVCLGGDMVHGALKHAAEADQHYTLFEQFYGAGHAIAQFIRNLSRLVPKVRIYNTVGNHSRFSDQHKMPTCNRYSNFDLFLATYIEALTRDLNLEWHLDKQPVALFDVQGHLFHLSHGDELKGGDKSLGIPNHAVGRLVSSKNQLFGKFGQRSPDFYLVGHLHREIVLPHARGSFIVNGGFPGVDGYGLAAGFSPVDPSQVFFLVHPRHGKTATYSISLKHAERGGEAPYVIPGAFAIAA